MDIVECKPARSDIIDHEGRGCEFRHAFDGRREERRGEIGTNGVEMTSSVEGCRLSREWYV